MSYVKHVLQPGETIRYQGSVHWIIYWPATLFAILGVVATAFGPAGWIVAALFLCIALVFTAHTWFIRWTTENVVTDRRVIHARGFIWRNSAEVHMDKIESVDVDQSVLGRGLWRRYDTRDGHDVRAIAFGGKADRLPQPGHCGLTRHSPSAR